MSLALSRSKYARYMRALLLILSLLLLYSSGAATQPLETSAMAVVVDEEGFRQSLTVAERAWLQAHPLIRVGVDPNFPPYTFREPGGRYQGLGLDYLHLIESLLGVTFDVVPGLSWEQVLAAGETGEIDLIATAAITPQRAPLFSFTEHPMQVMAVIVTRGDNTRIRTPRDLKGATVALVKNYALTERLVHEYPNIKGVFVDTALACLQTVADGHAEACVESFEVSNYHIRQNSLRNLKFASTYSTKFADQGFAVRRDWPELARIIDKALASIPAISRETLYEKWVDVEYTPYIARPAALEFQLTPEERAWLNTQPTVRIGADQDWAPVEFIDEDGVHQGITRDYLDLLERYLGIRFERVATDSWNETFSLAREGKVDLLLAAVPTEKRRQHLDFTDSYLSMPIVVFTGEDTPYVANLGKLSGKRVAVVSAYAIAETMAENHPQIELALVNDIVEGLELVSSGQVVAFIDSVLTTSYHLSQLGYTNIKVGGETPYRHNIAIAINRQQPMLASSVKKAFSIISEQERNAIHQKWMSITLEKRLDLTLLWQVLAGVALLLIAFTYWNRRLAREITERQRAETALTQANSSLLENESMLKEAQKNAHLGHWRLDLVTGELFWSNEIYRIFDIAPSEFGASYEAFLELIHPDDRDTVNEAYTRSLKTRHPYDIIHRLLMRDGRIKYVHEICNTEFNEVGDPLRSIGTVQDITELKTMEVALRESEERHREIFDTITDAVFVIGTDGSLVQANPAACLIYGYDYDEFIGLHATQLITPEYHHEFQCFLKDLAESGSFSGETIDLRKDGTTFFTEVKGAAITLNGKKQLLAIVRDITARKRVEEDLQKRLNELAETRSVMLSMMEDLDLAKEQAEEATQTKSLFLANMSHEIRTPMNAILGMLYLAQKTELNNIQRNYLRKTENAAHSLLGIINDILDFSKIEAGKLEIEQAEFGLDNVLEQLVDVVGYRAEEKGLEFLIRHGADAPYSLIGDSLRVGQILTNLCTNAVKFTERGEVEVSVQSIEKGEKSVQMMFCVRDTGIGLNREQQGKLFQKFSQVDQTITRKYGGTGLGLSISLKLAELMGGRCWIEQSEPGKGTIFCFTANFGYAKAAEEQRQQLLEKVLPVVSGLRVLVVDDSEASCEILAEMLKSFNFEIETVNSGEEALIHLEVTEESFDIVLMDWKMPGMKGDQATAAIHQSKHISPKPKMIMITSYGREEVMQSAEKVGMEGFLLKPVSPSMLLDAIMSALGKGMLFHEEAVVKAELPLLGGARLLLVEDNEINREFAVELLHTMGIEVIEAVDGEEGVEKVKQAAYDAILMDIQMPKMDGLEATRQIRKLSTAKDDRFANVPIIAMTAQAMDGDREETLEAGMNDYVSKPIDPELFAAALSRWVKVPEERQVEERVVVTQPAGDIGSLTSIDTTMGVKRVGGHLDAYLKLLERFRVHYADAVQPIRALIGQSKLKEAERQCHAFKGVAGNIGADVLFKTTTSIDKQLKQNLVPDEDELNQFELQLQRVIEEIASIQPETKSATADEPVIVDKESLLSTLEQLQSVIEEDLAEAESKLTELKQQSAGSEWAERVGNISACMDGFDVDGAKIVMQELIERLGK